MPTSVQHSMTCMRLDIIYFFQNYMGYLKVKRFIFTSKIYGVFTAGRIKTKCGYKKSMYRGEIIRILQLSYI